MLKHAKRISLLCEFMGVNTFSSLDEHNAWGSWPADYSPATVTKALRWIVGDTGYQLPIREYHYAVRFDMQQEWFGKILAEFPDTIITLCPGANASPSDVATMLQLPHTCIEGLNEPNTDFGSGVVPFAVTQAIQDDVWRGSNGRCTMGPSIVAGTPHPEGWITSYCNTQQNLDSLNNHMDFGNGHYYPPGSPDVPSSGYSVNEYIGGLWTAYAQKSIFITEYCSLLYNNEGHRDPDIEGERSAYYTITALFRFAQNGTMGAWWYALFDYGTTYKCGLFPVNERNPRSDAYILRALCHICADPGRDRRTFETDHLDYDVDTGNDPAISHELYQATDGTFYITLWRSLSNPGGTNTAVPIHFANKPSSIEEYDLMDCLDRETYLPIQSVNHNTIAVELDGGARIIKVTP